MMSNRYTRNQQLLGCRPEWYFIAVFLLAGMVQAANDRPNILFIMSDDHTAQANDWLINNTDFAPTVLDLAGVSTPEYMQGRSFAGALMGEPKPADWRNVTYYRYWMHKVFRTPAHFGIRSDRYKLIFFYGAGTDASEIDPSLVSWEFYDLEKDPHEMNNLYDNPEYQEVIRDMKGQLKSTRVELNETDVNYPHIQEIIRRHWD